MPTINVRGATGSQSRSTRAAPLLDPVRWNKALNDIERSTKKIADLTSGQQAAVGGVRIPREQQNIDRDLRRLITIVERQGKATGGSSFNPNQMFRQSAAMGGNAFWRARFTGAAASPLGRGYFAAGGGRGGGGGIGGGRAGGGRGFLGGGLGALGMRGLSAFEIARYASDPFSLVSSLENKALDASRPYMNLRLGSFALGRAGGFAGQGMQDLLYPGAGKALPNWMRDLNVGPSGGLQSLQNYGIAPTSSNQALKLMQTLGYFENVAPGFSGMSPGSATGAGTQAAGLGIVGAGGEPSHYLGSVGQVLEQAVAQGMDRARVLSAIQDTLGQIEKSGALSISAGGNMDLFTRLMNGGTPGGRTGALQAQTVGGIESTLSNLPNNSPAMMSVYSAFQKTPPTSVGAIGSLIGLSSDQMQEQMKSNPTFAAVVNNVISSYKAGRTGEAMLMVGQLLKSNPGAAAKMFGSYVNQIMPNAGPGTKALALQSVGIPFGASVGMNLDLPGLPGGGTTPQGYLSQSQTARGQGRGGYDDNVDYASELRKAGVPSQFIQSFISAGKRYDIDPLMLAAVAKQENQDWNSAGTSANRNGSTDTGLMQINSGSTKLSWAQLMNPDTNIMEGARILSEKRAMMTARGMPDIGSAVGAYNPGAAAVETAGVLNNYQGMLGAAGGVPTDVFGAAPTVEQQDIAASSVRFAEFGSHLVEVNKEMTDLIGTVTKLNQAFGNTLMKMPGAGDTGGWTNPYPGATPPM